MTVVRTNIKSRLSKEMAQPGGIAVGVAVQRAEKALGAMQNQCVEMVDGLLGELETGYASGSATTVTKDFPNLYRLSSRIIDIAFCLPGSQIEKAAYALCDLADRGEELGIWDQACIDVHISTLKLLRHGGEALTTAQRLHMVAGLRQATTRRLGKPAAPGEKTA
jgi:hypothetical protein